VNEEVLEATLRKIGNTLTELRKKKGYTSHESFAYDYDIPRMHYWRIENGKTNLTLRSLLRLLNIHKLTLEEFFEMMKEKDGSSLQ